MSTRLLHTNARLPSLKWLQFLELISLTIIDSSHIGRYARTMLPVPTFSFTIPSVHDDILLDCRVYHPTKFLQSGTAGETIWKKKGAIIAHPYAPLGGSYDDPVVVAAAAEILKKQFVIGTFNFRSVFGVLHSIGKR